MRGRIFLKIFSGHIAVLACLTILFLIFPEHPEITLISLPVALVLSLLVARSLSKPIRELASASRAVSEGNYSTRVSMFRSDEIGELASAFNEMAERVRTVITELRKEKEQLDTLVSSIPEGIIVVSETGTIVFANREFSKIVENSVGKKHWEALRSVDFNRFVDQAIAGKKTAKTEISVSGIPYMCSAAYLESSRDVIVIMHNVAESKKIEKMKKDLVTNVSHELRTPLTAIKGYLETMDEGEYKKEYLDIIKRHTERLIKIVDDLLLLSKLEDSGTRLDLEDVDLQKVVSQLSALFDRRLHEKGIRFNVSIEGNPVIKADGFKIEQMLVNLIDNAIKYTDKGEISLVIKPSEGGTRIEVSDTGIGIPKEHLGRIFERFYVVDKSRSRSAGGTGLGLSIVKHIVFLHGGTVDVESTPGKGTRFTIIIPAQR